jgi:hypothetical protein
VPARGAKGDARRHGYFPEVVVADERKGFWKSLLEQDPDVLAAGLVDAMTNCTIYRDGTFTTRSGFGAESARERLLGFDHDADSMRRKSVTGRGSAALLTGGVSLLASNNRGVVYVTVTGERSKVRTFTTRNPSGTVLSTIRSLKAAADAVIAQSNAAPPPVTVKDVPPPEQPNEGLSQVRRLQALADLFEQGMVTEAEFRVKRQAILEPEESLESVQKLKRLADLLAQGLITDEDFATKRRAILADL